MNSEDRGDKNSVAPGVDSDELMVQALFDELMQQCAPICKKEGDAERITQAFYFAKEAHKGVKRKSGEPYIIHPIAVARIVVVEIGLGVKSVLAALLHDVVEDTDYTVEDMEHHFGAKVASMVDGLTKLAGVVGKDGASLQAENFKKMLLTLTDDVRVILIKIADRLHNMRTLGSMAQHKQMKIASETIYLFAPLAHRLGLYAIKSEFEDLSLKFRFPEEYDEIWNKLELSEASRLEYINKFNAPIIQKLDQAQITYHISGRVKSVYSIWRKMKSKQIPFEQVYDLFAIRIVFDPTNVVPEKSQCWHIYSLVTDVYKPKPDRIRDWVNIPKANGYEALHCTVMGPDGVWAEVQIRSKRMDEVAERGFASHWMYKSPGAANGVDRDLEPWLGQLREALTASSDDAVEFLDNFKLNLLVSEIVVFTPKGESRTLPKGATVLDFAYDIHTKVGNAAIGAKINYKLSPIYAQIHSGDQIEVITSSSVKPQVEWLDHVITAKAKSGVKSFLKRENENNRQRGQEIFETQMRKIGVTAQARVFHKILPVYKCNNKDEFYSKVGAGIIDLSGIDKILKQNAASKLVKYWTLNVSKLFGGSDSSSSSSSSSSDSNSESDSSAAEGAAGDAERKLVMASCCNPIPGDEVVGFINADGSVEVHKKSCSNAIRLSAQHGERIVPAKWSREQMMSYLTVVEIRGIDRIGILLDVSKILTDELNVNIRAVSVQSHDGIFEGKIYLYVHNNEDLRVIMNKLSKVKGIEKVNRTESQVID